MCVFFFVQFMRIEKSCRQKNDFVSGSVKKLKSEEQLVQVFLSFDIHDIPASFEGHLEFREAYEMVVSLRAYFDFNLTEKKRRRRIKFAG